MQLVACPHCSHQLQDDGTLRGQAVACPACGGQFQMPQLVVARQGLVIPRRRTDYTGVIVVAVALALTGVVAAAIVVNGGLDGGSAKVTNNSKAPQGPVLDRPPAPARNASVSRPPKQGQKPARKMTAKTSDSHRDSTIAGWTRFRGPGLVPDADGNALPEWRDSSGHYSIIETERGYAPSSISNKQRIPVSSQLFYVTFEDAAEAARDHHAGGVRSMDFIRAWAGRGDDQ